MTMGVGFSARFYPSWLCKYNPSLPRSEALGPWSLILACSTLTEQGMVQISNNSGYKAHCRAGHEAGIQEVRQEVLFCNPAVSHVYK